MGKLIVIEGIDGSGKGTQSRRLTEYLTGIGMNALRDDFPRYGTKGAILTEGYLAGELGDDPSLTNAYAASLFFAMDRYWSFRTEWGSFYKKENSIVTCDRYTTANALHQCSKLEKKEWEPFLSWLWDTEYVKLGLPKPDKIVFLDMKPSVFLNLIDRRSESEKRQKDIHEHNAAYLEKCYEASLYVAEKCSWEHIMCYEGDSPRSMDDIFSDILRAVRDIV